MDNGVVTAAGREYKGTKWQWENTNELKSTTIYHLIIVSILSSILNSLNYCILVTYFEH